MPVSLPNLTLSASAESETSASTGTKGFGSINFGGGSKWYNSPLVLIGAAALGFIVYKAIK